MKGAINLYAGLENLKKIIDAFGHHKEDQALIGISSILKENYRESETTARIGADELVPIPVDTTREYVSSTHSRLNKAVELYNPRKERGY